MVSSRERERISAGRGQVEGENSAKEIEKEQPVK